MSDKKTTILQIKEMLVSQLNLGRTVESIADDEELFKSGLGLDSIDALEIIVGLEKNFGVKITDEDLKTPEKFFLNVRTLAEFVENKKK